MKVQIKGFKCFESRDGYSFQCTLYIDGVRIARVTNSGYGGDNDIFYKNGAGEEKVTFEKFKKLCTGAYPPSKDPTIDEHMNWQVWLEEKLLIYAHMKLKTRNRTLVIEDSSGDFRTIRGVKYDKARHEEIETALKVKYAGCRMINGMELVAEV